MAKEGSTVSGLMDSFATAISLALQHGVPLKVLCEKFAHTRFEPSGWTGNPQIGYAKSVMDYIFRWIQLRFLSGTQLDLFTGLSPQHQIPVTGTLGAAVNLSRPARPRPLSPTNPHLNPSEDPRYFARSSNVRGRYSDRTAPQGGIAPDLQARSGLDTPSNPFPQKTEASTTPPPP